MYSIIKVFMKDYRTIVVAYGDGIGPEIMEATLSILKEAGARINIETIEIGEKMYLKGFTSGISPEAWDKVFKHKILLKAPITTPQGKGLKSLNVTFRKSLGLYANVRPCTSFTPFVKSIADKMDLVICRENEEDLYAGIEYKIARNTAVSHKMITRGGSEKIIRYAFEYARNNGRKKVTCMVKDNIMKVADGMFHDVFKAVATEYKEIESNSVIVDIGSARIASKPQDFDVVVTLNLYGDIISDIAAEVSGSIGLAGSSNIGDDFGMFEAVHGSAPDIAGKGIANPSGLLNGAILMLEYIGQYDVAAKVKNAWLKTIEDGIHTGDIYQEGTSKKQATTHEFTEAIISNLGKEPTTLKKHAFKANSSDDKPKGMLKADSSVKKIIGADFLLDATGHELEDIANSIKDIHKDFKLHLISQRGLKVWPDSGAKRMALETIRCRFIGFADTGVNAAMVAELFGQMAAKFDIAVMHSLYTYDGQIGFTLAQGE
jgi:isocitrate dehydrogenase